MSPQRLRALQKHWQGPAAGAWEQEQGWCQKVRDSTEIQMLLRG